jgi:geranylgeranyl diphosphate synthase type II
MLIHLLRHANEADARRLKRFLAQSRVARARSDANWILDRMKSMGSVDHGRTISRYFAGATLYEFGRVFGDVPDSEEKQFLNEVIHYMVGRDL